MKKLVGTTAWWASLLLTFLGVASILVKVISTRKLPFSFVVTLSYGIITIMALLLSRNRLSLKSKVAGVLDRVVSVPAPLVYMMALVQTRVRRQSDLLQ
ncbi:MAG: hypothetical protein ACLQVG_14785 [Terriglobia bacterium]